MFDWLLAISMIDWLIGLLRQLNIVAAILKTITSLQAINHVDKIEALRRAYEHGCFDRYNYNRIVKNCQLDAATGCILCWKNMPFAHTLN